MRKFVLTLLVVLLATFSMFAQKEYYFKFEINERAELEVITRMISIDNVHEQTVYAYANEQQLEKFKQKTDYNLRMLEHPRTHAKSVDMATSVAEMSDWDKYPTYDVYVQMMNDFANDYPDIASLENIGTTVNGRDLLVLKISDNVDQQEDEPEFFYTSTMHGDETAGFVFMLRFIDSLLTNYGSNPEITDYVDNLAIFINPNANPDGTYSGGNSTVSSATRGNANVIDLNRNFPDPDAGDHPDDYDWQPETIAMINFAEQHHFTLSANFHGGAEVANYPWDTWERDHVDDAWFQHVSHVYADPAIANSPSGYFTGISNDGVTQGYDWYSITGGRQDFMTYFQQCREVTMEVSSQKLLSTDSLRDYWNYNKQSLFNYMEQALYGIRGIVTDENGGPLEAMVEIEAHDSDLDSSMVFTDPDVGDYHRMIEQGTYNVIFSAYGYFTDTVENVTVNYDDSVRVDASLTPKSTYTVEGNVTNDETGDPIENAEVTILNTPLSPVYTNSSGDYTISGVMEGSNTIRVRKSGYATVTDDIYVSESNIIFDFILYDADIEDFESGDFSSFAWNFEGDAAWEVVSSDVYEASYSAKSGGVTDDQESVLSVDIMVDEAGELSFYKKVSSESGYDYLEFYIDGTKEDSWSGEIDWSPESYTLSEGSHTLRWNYTKDGSVSNGSDCAWIDYITFPKLVPPALNFTPDTLETFMEVNTTQTETLELVNSANGTVDYTLSVEDAASNPWIDIPASSGSVESMQTENVDVEITTGAEDSLYTCNILLSHNGAKTDTIIPVVVHADYYPELTVDPAEIEEEILMDSVKSVYVKLNNSGSGVLDYDAEIENSSGNPWLSIQNTTGSLDEGTDSIKVTFDGTGMDAGIYNANILINDNSKGQTLIPANLIINEPENFVIHPQELSETIKRYESAELSFYVKNIIPETIDLDLSLEDSTYASMFELDATQASLNSGDSVFFTLDVKPGGILPGEYECNLVIQSQMRYIKKLPLSIEVQEQEMINVEPDTLDLILGKFETITQGLTLDNLLEQDINLHYSLSDSVFSSVLQLKQGKDTLNASASISKEIKIQPEDLDTGRYSFQLLISSNLRKVVEVPVNLEVIDQGVFSFNPESLNPSLLSGETDTTEVFIENHSVSNVEYNIKESLNAYKWISVNSLNDTIQGKDSISMKVFFDAGELSEGEYVMDIQLNQNYNDSIFTIPVLLEVDKNTSFRQNFLEDQVQVNCYPNPFYNKLSVVLNLASTQQELRVSVINDNGRMVYFLHKNGLNPGKYKFPLDFNAENISGRGLFYLKIETETGVIVKKLLRLK